MKTKKLKKYFSIMALVLILAMVLGTVASALIGCGSVETGTQNVSETDAGQTKEDNSAGQNADTAQTPANDTADVAAKDKAEEPAKESAEASNEDASNAEGAEASSEDTSKTESTDGALIRVAALKGPTTIGLVNLIDEATNAGTANSYEFEMYTAGSDIMAAMVAGKVDIGLVPSNVACVMNTKVEGGVSVIDINTLGVLECVSADSSIAAITDLAGKTVYMTGQGATPEYTMNYLLKTSGITDCSLEFKSEPTEIVSAMAEDESIVAVLPQPFVTAALSQNEKLVSNFKLEDEWAKISPDSGIVTGVTVVTNSFLNEHEDAVKAFLSDHEKSAEAVLADVDKTAKLVVEQGIIAKEPLAKKAIPSCSTVCITGDKMKTTLEGYLKVLFDEDPKSVGGAMPDDSFYYLK